MRSVDGVANHIFDSQVTLRVTPWTRRGSVRHRTRVPLSIAPVASSPVPLRIRFSSASLRGWTHQYRYALTFRKGKGYIEAPCEPYLMSNSGALVVFPRLDRKLGAMLKETMVGTRSH